MSILGAIMFLHAAPAPPQVPSSGMFFVTASIVPRWSLFPAELFEMGDPGGEEGRPEGPVRTVSVGPFAMARVERPRACLKTSFAIRDMRRRAIAVHGTLTWERLITVQERPGKIPMARASPLPKSRLFVPAGKMVGLSQPGFLRKPAMHIACPPKQSGNTPPTRVRTPTTTGRAAPKRAARREYLRSRWAGRFHPLASCRVPRRLREDGAVGSYRPNAFGLYDMTGNVWEWVEDCYIAPYPATSPNDGTAYQVEGDCARRSVRGGSWITTTFRNRPAWRGRDPEDFRTWIFGFRVARDLSSSELATAVRMHPNNGKSRALPFCPWPAADIPR